MTLTPKESSLIKDLKKQEELCIEKYEKYADEACDPHLSDLFTRLAGTEKQHLQTLVQIESGKTPQISQAGGQGQKQQAAPKPKPSKCSAEEKQQDQFLCQDALAMEKHVSSTYNTSIFEFTDTNTRDALNHIQKEEQEHGEQIYNYMAVNGMYQ